MSAEVRGEVGQGNLVLNLKPNVAWYFNSRKFHIIGNARQSASDSQ